MASIRVEDVYKEFGKVQVINGVDFNIEDGELMVFVGPSGCGKTTLLRLISGLESITGGNIYIGDEQVNDVPPKDRNIAMVFQNYALYPHMTVAQNIDFGLKLRGVKKEQREESISKVAKMLGLSELVDRKPRELSGGQRQRVAMGRCIVRDPKVFLMDEPLSNLDAKLRNQMRVEIKQLQRNLGKTMIYVTHDQIEAMTLADRIVVLDQGVISQIGTPDQLYSRPANIFVGGFIGTPAMNFIPAIHMQEKKIRLAEDIYMNLSKDRIKDLAAFEKSRGKGSDNKLFVGIRPEHVRIENKDIGNDNMVSWSANIDLCETLGSESLVHTRIGNENLNFKVTRADTPKEGQDIFLTFAADNAHIFDEESGNCISYATKV